MLAVTFGVIALILGVMATVLVNFRDNSGNTGLSTKTDSNTKTLNNLTDTYFADYDVKGNPATSCTLVSAYNGTDARYVTTNLTLEGTGGCYAKTDATYNGMSIQLNYTMEFTTYTATYNITETGLQGQDTLSGWQTTWVVIFASAVILGIISAYLFFKRE